MSARNSQKKKMWCRLHSCSHYKVQSRFLLLSYTIWVVNFFFINLLEGNLNYSHGFKLFQDKFQITGVTSPLQTLLYPPTHPLIGLSAPSGRGDYFWESIHSPCSSSFKAIALLRASCFLIIMFLITFFTAVVFTLSKSSSSSLISLFNLFILSTNNTPLYTYGYTPLWTTPYI